jgi:hypothetical protein
LLLFLSKSKGTDFQKQKIFFFRPGFEHCCGPWHRPDCKVRWGERCPDPLWSLVQPWTLSSSLSSIQALTRNEGCPRHCDRAWILDGAIFFFTCKNANGRPDNTTSFPACASEAGSDPTCIGDISPQTTTSPASTASTSQTEVDTTASTSVTEVETTASLTTTEPTATVSTSASDSTTSSLALYG